MNQKYLSQIDAERDIYGSFTLGQTEFALSVKAIQEVVNEPDSYSSMPLAPNYLLGLFNLRDMIVPVIDLYKVFDFIEESVSVEKKIAIIEHGEFCVGLLFDKTGEIFSGRDVERSEFTRDSGRKNDSIIQGVFKLDNGSRIIQILDPYEVLQLERVPLSNDWSRANERLKKTGVRKQCISFNVGKALCGIDIDRTQEIVKLNKIDTTALVSDLCLGVINIRGDIVPTLDFAVLLGYESTIDLSKIDENDYRVIVMKLGAHLFGLIVDSVESIISYFKDDVVLFPILSDKKQSLFEGCIVSSEEKTILLNCDEILSNEEISIITRGHQDLYVEEKKAQEADKALELNDKKYITFTIDANYALEIDEVIEVINQHEDLIQPPNLCESIKGMINLRGDLITIIDPKVLYGIEEEERESYKILIFKVEETKYGLIVDSVDSIASLSQKNKVKVPEITSKERNQKLADDIKGAVQVKGVNESEVKTLMVLNLASIASKIAIDSAA